MFARRRVGILSPLGSFSGNRSTALRIQALLEGPQFECVLAGVTAKGAVEAEGINGDETLRKYNSDGGGGGGAGAAEDPLLAEESIASWATSQKIELVVALHAYVYRTSWTHAQQSLYKKKDLNTTVPTPTRGYCWDHYRAHQRVDDSKKHPLVAVACLQFSCYMLECIS